MKITIESTNELTTVNGQQVRHWRGVTERGVACHVFVANIGVDPGPDSEQFARELVETQPPAEDRVISLRAIL